MDMDNEKNLTDELLDGLIRNVKDLEGKVTKLPDHTEQFELLNKHLSGLKESLKQQDIAYPAEQIQRHLEELQKKVSSIPQVIPVRHHFDLKSKGFIIGTFILLVIVALCVGVSVSTITRSRELKGGADKFRMVRQSYTVAAEWADRIYTADPVKAMRSTDSLEALSLTIAAAEREAKEKEEESSAARKRAKLLQKRKRGNERRK